MNFNSLAFLLFLPVVVGMYWAMPHKGRKIWLLAASYFFYLYANPALIFLLLASTVVDYLCSNGIEINRHRPTVMKQLLLGSIVTNLGLLFTFKYFDFFAENINALSMLAGISYRVPELGLILPVGISFYTFQTMSYTIDVYRGDFHAEKDPIAFALYVAYFPQLVAGPIESAGNLLPQLKKEQHFLWDDFTAGIRLLLCGFFRKCVVADYVGVSVNQVFQAPENANSLAVLLAAGLFCIQMYCDFAGYSEIAAGCARLMGVRLIRNFDRPYLSQSYAEFFRRWHISLNRWFTSYVYIPLGGSRRGLARKLGNTIVVFALCGLWHGARWTYVLWGLYAAFWVCLESVILKPMEKTVASWGIDLEHPLVKLLRRSYMFLIFLPAAILFRADSIHQAGQLFARIALMRFGVADAFAALGLSGAGLIRMILTLTAMTKLYAWGLYELPSAGTASRSAEKLVSAVYLTVIIALSWIALLATQDIAGFAYFRF